jgi:hypothetical protein
MKKAGRRKFLFAGLSLAALWASFRFATPADKKKPMRFLTQEGKLVEIDLDKLPARKRAASKTEIQQWIKK